MNDLPDRGRSEQSASAGCRFFIADVELALQSDDPGLIAEFESVFGGVIPSPSPRASLTAHVDSRPGEAFGRLIITGDNLSDPAAFLLGFASPTVPMIPFDSEEEGVRLVGMEGLHQPLFEFRGSECRFLKVPRWHRIVAHVLFLRLLRLRPDLLFFHAASVGVDGRGLLLVGPKGTGKSTLSLAVAARGHQLFGDETAAYDPQTRLLLPMLRPVGIKPGIRSKPIDAALRLVGAGADEDGIMRVPVGRLVPQPPSDGAVLRDVIFLRGFGQEAKLDRIVAGRDELAALQPLRSSTFETDATRKVFEMIRLLGSIHCYHLIAGDPDATAELIEKRMTDGTDC